MPQTYIRPDLLYAWRGQSQLVVTDQGYCAGNRPLTGFYFREARFLSALRLRLNGERPWLSQAAAIEPAALRFDYVYPEILEFGGGGTDQAQDATPVDTRGIPQRALALRSTYRLDVSRLHIELEVTNHSLTAVEFDVEWELEADFADLQEAISEKRRQHAPVTRHVGEAELRFDYQHADLPYRTLVECDARSGWRGSKSGVSAHMVLDPQEQVRLWLRVEPLDFHEPLSDEDAIERQHTWTAWRESFTRVSAPAGTLADAVVDSSVRDFAALALLHGQRDEWLAGQAGIPAYPAFFGRDAITAGWQAAFLDHGAMLDASLTRLGRMQSDRFDDWRDEEPGRIPYQVRQGPLARLNLNPYTASYADYASPLMFVISLAHLYAWTGSSSQLRRHWDAARRILDWARDRGDLDGDGYLEYRTRSELGPANQGWKDSGGAIVHEDGSPVAAPLGTCELQGYWYAAQQLFAVMCAALGYREDAVAYWRSAAELKRCFNNDWWIAEDGCLALAMDRDKQFVRGCASNAGHCLATGIVERDRLPTLVQRLFQPDLFSGWGIRTLASGHAAYNPVSYHRGSVWPVENATIAFGLRRFGFDAEATRLCAAQFELASLYPDFRIPECVGGYERTGRNPPGAYPRANPIQLWNSSGFMLILHTLLGLQPVAPLGLLIVDPVLPTWLPEVVLRDLRLGESRATLRFWRDERDVSHAEVLEQEGALHVVKQPPLESLTAGFIDRLSAFIDGMWHRTIPDDVRHA